MDSGFNSTSSAIDLMTQSGNRTSEILCSDGTNTSSVVNRIISQISIVVLMFGLGCSTEIRKMWSYVKNFKQFSLAMFLQLFVMPFLGFGLSQAFQMTQAEVIGVIIQASCPGGVYSNIISYYLDGNIHLSVVITTISNILALGTIPLWLFVFSQIIQLQNSCLKIPYDALGYTLLCILVPLAFGLLFKLKFPKKSEFTTKICTLTGSISVLVFAIIVAATQSNDLMKNISWRIFVVAFFHLTLAFFLGYFAARVPCFSFDVPDRRTIAIETVLQNGALSNSIVLISFDPSYRFYGSIFLYPLFYNAAMLILGFTLVSTYLTAKRFNKCRFFYVDEEKEILSIDEKISSAPGNDAFTEDEKKLKKIDGHC